MKRTLLLLPLFALALIFALSGCSSGGGGDRTLSFRLPSDLNQPLSTWWQQRINNYLVYLEKKNESNESDESNIYHARELLPATNFIDLYIYNETDPDNEHYVISLDLATDPPYVSVPVTSDGPYTIECYATHRQGILNLCYTAIKSTGHVPDSGTINIYPSRVQYAEITRPAETVTHGNVLNMVGDLRVPVDIDFSNINWIFVEFNTTTPINNFYLEPITYAGFTKDEWQRLDFSQSVVTTYPLGGQAVFNCESIGIDFVHPVIGPDKNFIYFFWNPDTPDDPENPPPLYTVTVNP